MGQPRGTCKRCLRGLPACLGALGYPGPLKLGNPRQDGDKQLPHIPRNHTHPEDINNHILANE